MNINNIEKGILMYFSSQELYAVQYSCEGYSAILDNPAFTEIRLDPSEEWIPMNQAPLHNWIGKPVEARVLINIKSTVKELLKEIWEVQNEVTLEEELDFFERLQSDERMTEEMKFAVTRHIQQLNNLSK